MLTTSEVRALLLLSFAATSACGGSTDDSSASTSGLSGQAGSAGSTASGGTGARGGSVSIGAQDGSAGSGAAGNGAQAGSAGAAGGSGGSAGGSCIRTEQTARIAVERAGQPRLDCSGGVVESVFTVLEGAITRVEETAFEIDSCPPNADCAPSLTRFEVQAPGLSLELPVQAFVKVSYEFTGVRGCQRSLEVSTIPSWGGVANPAGPNSVLLLGIADGGSTFPASPYRVDRVALGCHPMSRGCGNVTPDEYALELVPSAAPDRVLRLGMGQSASIDLMQSGMPGGWTAHNLRSYQSHFCDDYWNFAWYIRWQPPTG